MWVTPYVIQEVVLQYVKIDPLLKNNWTDSSGNKISFTEIVDEISGLDCEIYVGSDSNPSRLPIVLAVSIVIIKRGEFAKYFFYRLKPWESSKPSLRQRLQNEVEYSCYIANEIRELLPDREIIVHADVNSDFSTASGKFANSLKNFIVAFGFSANIKPKSWAASCVADRCAG